MTNAFGKINVAIIALGALVGFLGLYLLSLEPVNNPISLNVAPFVTLGGYLVLIPAGILWPSKSEEKKAGQPEKA
jgi:hypothetical protein